MKRLKTVLRQIEFHILAFCFFLFLFLCPVLRGSKQAGQEKVYVYYFITWGACIVVLSCISRFLHKNNP